MGLFLATTTVIDLARKKLQNKNKIIDGHTNKNANQLK